MRFRPICALLAVALLLVALQVGNPFRAAESAGGTPVAPAAAPLATRVLPVQPVALGMRAPAPTPPIDRDGIGPCPEAGLPPVVGQGRDQDGLDTWWHADGSITKRTVSEIGGVAVPAIVRLKPAAGRVRGAGTPANEGESAVR
jgi:hypothetical protein